MGRLGAKWALILRRVIVPATLMLWVNFEAKYVYNCNGIDS